MGPDRLAGQNRLPLARVCGNSMKKSILSALLLAWTITQAVAVSETYEINPENSSVLFKVRFLWTTNIEGCFCGGVSGRVSLHSDAPHESTVKLEIKTDTLNTGVAQLTNEIKGPAFLDVEKFPLITFKNTSAQRRRNFPDYTRPQLIFPHPLIEIDLIAPPWAFASCGVYWGNQPLEDVTLMAPP